MQKRPLVALFTAVLIMICSCCIAQQTAAPPITTRCVSGNCQLGQGELLIFDKQGILTDRLTGEFGAGEFIRGTHYMYGNGITANSVEKDGSVFNT